MTGLPLSDESVTGSPESLVNVKSGAGSPSEIGMARASSTRRAVGVVRVSRVGDRDGERFVSPTEQRESIESACAREGLHLVEVFEELDVSGGADLAQRPGLRRAVDLVESGNADVVVVAYLDRLVRSLRVQEEIMERVERAEGAILAVDVGEVRADTASRWLSSTMLGMVAEYARRVTAERTSDAKRRAVERGVPPFPNVPPGYRRAKDGRIEPDPKKAPVVAEAFRLRSKGATVMEVRDYLRKHGIERTYHGVQALLGSRIVLGELRFGKLVNTESHLPIVDAVTWQRVQRMRVSRGRRAKSERLLARLGVLRCGTCGGRMVVGSSDQGGRRYWHYRCSPVSDCPRRVTVSAEMAERAVIEKVKELVAGITGSVPVADGLSAAEEDLARYEQELEAAIRAFTGFEDEAAARERLLELRDQRDQARDHLEELQAAIEPAATLTITAGDWDQLSLDGRRALIRAVIDRVDVQPGHGPERLVIRERA